MRVLRWVHRRPSWSLGTAFIFAALGRLAIALSKQFHISDYSTYLTVARTCREAVGAAPGESFVPPLGHVGKGYPPLGTWLLCAPLATGASERDYASVFRAEMALFDLVTWMAILQTVKTVRPSSRIAPVTATLFYGLGGLCLPHVLYDRFDLAVSATIALASRAIVRRSVLGFVAVTLVGTFVKLVPALFALPAAFTWLGTRAWSTRRWFATLAIGAAGSGGIWYFLPDSLGSGLRSSAFGSHLWRGIQIESMWAVPANLRVLLGRHNVIVTVGSQEVQHAEWFGTVAAIAPMVGLLVWAGYLFTRGRRQRFLRPQVLDRYVLGVYLLSVVVFLGTQRVLSPQYIIWLLPVCSIWIACRPSAGIAIVALCVLLLTYVEFDLGYRAIAFHTNRFFTFALIVRNIAILVLWRELHRSAFADLHRKSRTPLDPQV